MVRLEDTTNHSIITITVLTIIASQHYYYNLRLLHNYNAHGLHVSRRMRRRMRRSLTGRWWEVGGQLMPTPLMTWGLTSAQPQPLTSHAPSSLTDLELELYYIVKYFIPSYYTNLQQEILLCPKYLPLRAPSTYTFGLRMRAHFRLRLTRKPRMARKRLKPSKLEMELEDLAVPERKASLEQYSTPPHIAAHLLWEISQHCGSIRDEFVLDLGCGNGILGLGCLLRGAKFVVGGDIDHSMIESARKNAAGLGFTEGNIYFVNQDVREFDVGTSDIPGLVGCQVDAVVMNPPFGTMKDSTGIDAVFVCKALESAKIVYSMHKSSTREFWKKKAVELGVQVNVLTEVKFNIEQTFRFHKYKSVDIQVDLIQFRKL